MSKITEILLFYSNFSAECKPCIEFIQRVNIPVSMICLDSKESREMIMSGKRLQIKAVPSLMVIYNDTEMQLFVGRPKIIAWLQNIINPHPNNQFINPDQAQDNTQNITHDSPRSGKPNKKKRGRKQKKQSAPINDDSKIELIFEDENDQNENLSNKTEKKFGFPTRPENPNVSVMEAAKRMMAERNNSLNIKDDA
jgi:hypothetical protein